MGGIWYLVILAAVMLVSVADIGVASAESTDSTTISSRQFISPRGGVRLTWPPELEQMNPDSPAAAAALLLLQPKSGDFPTLNLIEVPGRFDPDRAAETVADSYRAVGITDARVRSSRLLRQGWPELELTYSSQTGQALSWVLVIPRPDSHLVLTMVDRLESAPTHRELWESIVASIILDSPSTARDSGQARPMPPIWIVLIVLAVAAATLTSVWQRREQHRRQRSGR